MIQIIFNGSNRWKACVMEQKWWNTLSCRRFHRCFSTTWRVRLERRIQLTPNGKNKILCSVHGFSQQSRHRYSRGLFFSGFRTRFGMRSIVISLLRWRRVCVNYDMSSDPSPKTRALLLSLLRVFAVSQNLLLQLVIKCLIGT